MGTPGRLTGCRSRRRSPNAAGVPAERTSALATEKWPARRQPRECYTITSSPARTSWRHPATRAARPSACQVRRNRSLSKRLHSRLPNNAVVSPARRGPGFCSWGQPQPVALPHPRADQRCGGHRPAGGSLLDRARWERLRCHRQTLASAMAGRHARHPDRRSRAEREQPRRMPCRHARSRTKAALRPGGPASLPFASVRTWASGGRCRPARRFGSRTAAG
jgi:hypothetical protein